MSKFFHIRCQIERGGFSGERTFTIPNASGEPLIGVAYYEYFLDADQNPISEDVPPEGQIIDGFVMCRMVRRVDSSTVVVEVPSSDTIAISDKALLTGTR
jgi:deoxycytidine triphosphate deaminase